MQIGIDGFRELRTRYRSTSGGGSELGRQVFITSTESYISTNWRFALSTVFRLRSPTTSAMTLDRLIQTEAIQVPSDPHHGARQTQEPGDPERLAQKARKLRRGNIRKTKLTSSSKPEIFPPVFET